MEVKLDLGSRLDRLIFDQAEQVQPALLARLLSLLRYPYALVRDLVAGDLNLRAMSLVYTTLLSIVPLVAFAFAVLKGLGIHRDLEPLVYEFLRPVGERAGELTTQIMQFVENTRGGVLGSVGLLFLLYTVVSTIQKVEESFNYAWHVEQPRSFVRRVSEYLSLMVIAPIFLVVSFGLFSVVQNHAFTLWLGSHEPFGTVLAAFAASSHYYFVAAMFVFLYGFIPNTRVRFRAALIGGVVAGILWAATGAAFARFVAASTQMVAVYAGFAIFLAALVWIYLSWLILLLGAQLSFYVQNPQYLRAGQLPVRLTSRLRERLGLSVMVMVARDYAAGTPRWNLRTLSERLDVPSSALATVTDSLERAGLLLTSERDLLLPGRDLSSISVRAIISAVRDEQQPAPWLLCRARTEPSADEIADGIDAAIRERVSDLSLRDLIAQPAA